MNVKDGKAGDPPHPTNSGKISHDDDGQAPSFNVPALTTATS